MYYSVREVTLDNYEIAIPPLLELRQHRDYVFLHKMIPALIADGIQLIYYGNNDKAFSVAVFRVMDMLFSGKTLYTDDFVTLKGHQKKVMLSYCSIG